MTEPARVSGVAMFHGVGGSVATCVGSRNVGSAPHGAGALQQAG